MSEKIQDKAKISEIHLQKSFTEIYEDFFFEYPLVISCNVSIPLLPPISNLVGGFGLVQKLPTKIYIGIKPIPEKKIYFDPIQAYDTHEKRFKKKAFEARNEEKIMPNVKIFLEKENFHKWMHIGFLYEKDAGFGTYANTISLLTVGLFLLTGKLQHKEGILEHIEDNKQLRKTAKEIYGSWTSMIKGQNTYNIEASIIEAKEPLILMPTTSDRKTTYKVSEFFGTKQEKEIPEIDLIILDFGIEYEFDITKKRFENFVSHTGIQTKNAKSLIQKTNEGFDFPDAQEIEKSFQKMITIEKTKMLAYLGETVKNPFDQHALKNFIKTYNNRYAFSLLIENENHIIDTIEALFDKHKVYQEEYIGICPFTTAEMGGSILIIAPEKKSRHTILKTLEEFKAAYRYPFAIEYISREEGMGGEAMKVEQDIINGLRSPLLQKDIVIAQTMQGDEIIGKHETLLKNYKKALVMDMVGKKIYIQGKKASSKEIFSQYFTMELCEKLLENINNEITNKELETSSYSKYKNQLVGKILIPLQKIAEKHFWQKLDISCKGDNHNFDIKLRKTSFPLVIIKKFR